MALAQGAQAQEPPPGAPNTERDAESALELGRRALEYFERGELEAAYALFVSAERLAHSPVFLLYQARCLRESGKLVAARDVLARVAQEEPGPEAPAPWEHAVAAAKGELAALTRRIPTVCVTSRDFPTAAGATLDDKPVPLGKECSGIAVDPGEHTVVIRAHDGSTSTVALVVTEGQRNVAPAPAAKQERPGGAPAAVARGPSTREWVGYGTLGLGGLALATGVVTGIVAVSRTSNLACRDDVCPRTERPRVDDAKRWATAATVSFAVGGVLSATGVVVLLSAPQKTGRAAGWLGFSGAF